jgi:hypothetical protein
VRINLVDSGKQRKKRKKRSHRYESSIAQPLPRRRLSRRRRKAAAKLEPTLSPADELDVQGRPPLEIDIPWRVVLVKFPVLLLLAGLLALAAYVTVADAFYVYSATVEGAHYLDARSIYEVAQINEHHVFWLNPQEVADNITHLQGIESAHVRLQLPNRVSIQVEERAPIIVWRSGSMGRDLWLDKEGMVLPYGGDIDSPDVVYVMDSSDRNVQEGDFIKPEGIAQSVVQLAAAVPEAELFFYQAERGLSFNQKTSLGEWPVFVGTTEDLSRKIQVVQTLNQYLVERNIRPGYVDVRMAEHPLYGTLGSTALMSAGGN